MNHSVFVGRERKESQCGPSTNDIDNHTILGVRPVFYAAGSVFSLLHAGFSSRLSVENRFDPLYI